MNQAKKNKYLPSKKFTVVTVGIFIVLMIIFFVSKWISSKNTLRVENNQNSNQVLAENTTLNDLVEKDTDGDGVPDWEEALWGLDPKNKYTNAGVSDFDWVKQKREELNLKTNQNDSNGELNKTQKFAREFFTTVTALKQSGNLDDTTISNISQTLGGNITNPDLPPLYKDSDISVSNNTSNTDEEKYYSKLQDLFSKYQEKGLGNELDIASQFGDQSNSEKLDSIAQAYQGFTKEALKLKVPLGLSTYHLDIINNAANTGIAVQNLSKMQNDPVVGLAGLSQYQKYVFQFIQAAQDLKDNLSSNAIINSN